MLHKLKLGFESLGLLAISFVKLSLRFLLMTLVNLKTPSLSLVIVYFRTSYSSFNTTSIFLRRLLSLRHFSKLTFVETFAKSAVMFVTDTSPESSVSRTSLSRIWKYSVMSMEAKNPLIIVKPGS